MRITIIAFWLLFSLIVYAQYQVNDRHDDGNRYLYFNCSGYVPLSRDGLSSIREGIVGFRNFVYGPVK